MTNNSNGNIVEKCQLCGGTNTPHQMDSYHYFLQAIMFAQENLKNAKRIADKGLPSIQKQLKESMESLEKLRKESLVI